MDIGDPVAQRLVHRVLQRVRAAGHRDDFSAQQLHPEHVRLLTLDVLCTHIDNTGQAKTRANGGGGNAVLASARFGDDPRFAHADCKQDLPDAIVDFVRAGMV